MSTRAMSHQYMAGGVRSVPQNDSLDLFGFKERREKRMMEFQTELQKQIMELEHKHQQDLENLRAENEMKIKSSQQVTDYLKTRNIADTPENRARGAKELTDLDFANARQIAQNQLQMGAMENKSLMAPGAQEASDVGTRLKLSAIPPQLLGAHAGLGETAAFMNVPGVNDAVGGQFGLNLLKGGTEKQTAGEIGGYPVKGPDGKIYMMNAKPFAQKTMTPGTLTRPSKPFTPQELSSVLGGTQQSFGTPLSATPTSPWDEDYAAQTGYSPIKANNQDRMGNISATPKNPSIFDLLGEGPLSLFNRLFGPNPNRNPYNNIPNVGY